MQTIQLPKIPDGWYYAGILLVQQRSTFVPFSHLIVSADEHEGLPWQQAMEWASDHGGELFDLRESALCIANLKPLFRPQWYWTREQYSADLAWGQGFLNGGQGYDRKVLEFRARAVRRLPL